MSAMTATNSHPASSPTPPQQLWVRNKQLVPQSLRAQNCCNSWIKGGEKMDEFSKPGKVDGHFGGRSAYYGWSWSWCKIRSYQNEWSQNFNRKFSQIPCLTPAFPFKKTSLRIASVHGSVKSLVGHLKQQVASNPICLLDFAGRHFAHRGFLTFPPRIIKMCGPAIPASELLVYRVYFHWFTYQYWSIHFQWIMKASRLPIPTMNRLFTFIYPLWTRVFGNPPNVSFHWFTLPETNSSPLKMDGWNTSLSYWEGNFSGANR